MSKSVFVSMTDRFDGTPGVFVFTAASLLLAASAAAWAGDASGFDPASIEQCLDGDSDDCAAAGMSQCLDYAKQKYSGDDPDFPEKNCLDAAHQAWEAKLTHVYQRLMDLEAERGIKPSEMLRQTEHSWIAFRDDLCAYEVEAAVARDKSGEIAKLTCLRDEAARHWLLLNDRLKQ